MAIVTNVDLKLKVDINDSIKYQILTYCFFNKTLISNTDLDFLTELSKNPKVEISKFCNILTEKSIFKSPQSARNAISKAEKKNLLIILQLLGQNIDFSCLIVNIFGVYLNNPYLQKNRRGRVLSHIAKQVF